MDLSIVVPVYNEEKNIPEFLNRVRPVIEKLTNDYEIIFAMDPSRDRTEEVVEKENARDSRVKLLKFSRRFGQPAATLAGLGHTKGDAVIVIDVDLQDPPELVQDMVEKWKQGFDVVYAQRISRKGETIIKRIVSYLGYRLINRIADVTIPPNTGDFRLMSRRVVNEVVRLKESHGFLRGMVALVGFNQTSVQFDRAARFVGQGNYNRFLGSMRIGMNGVICFSNYLLTLSTAFGFLCAFVAFVGATIYFGLKLTGYPFPDGFPTSVILILFMGGIQLIGIGILGEHIGRIYEEVKQRPKYILDRAIGFEPSELGARATFYQNGSLGGEVSSKQI